MALVVSSIGTTGRTYSSIAAWHADLPANFVTAGNIYEGQCYNDTEFQVTASISLSGNTTDSTHYQILSTGAGQSFRDNSPQTHALNYAQANGVGIRQTAGTSTTLLAFNNYTVIKNLQIKCEAGAGAALKCNPNVTVDNCIIVADPNANSAPLYVNTNNIIRNSLILNIGTTGAPNPCCVFNIADGITVNLYFCDLVVPSDSAGGILNNIIMSDAGSTANCFSCAFYGATTAVNGGVGTYNYTTCMTDLASPPTGVTGSTTYANQFVAVTAAAGDYRQKAGANLRGAATADATNGATDIVGTARPNAGNWDIGCWELFTAVAARGCRKLAPLLGVGCFFWGAKKIQENAVRPRRSFLLLRW